MSKVVEIYEINNVMPYRVDGKEFIKCEPNIATHNGIECSTEKGEVVIVLRKSMASSYLLIDAI